MEPHRHHRHYSNNHIKHLSYTQKREDIAREMNISIKSVGRYKQKTIDLLRTELKDYLSVILLLLGL